MADPREIQKWRATYRNSSNDQLIQVTHTMVEFSAHHIAAKQELEFRRQKEAEERAAQAEQHHKRSIQRADRANWIALLALAVAVVALIVAIAK